MKAKTKHEANGPKVRTDCWAAVLTPDQQWKLYHKAQVCGDWNEALDWANEEFHLDLSPSRSSFYSWMGAMRKLESERRLEEFSFAIAEYRDLGKQLPKAKSVVMTFQTLATEAAVKGNLKAAITYANIARTFQTMHIEMRDFNQKQSDVREEKKRQHADDNLTDEERAAKIRELLGIA